jgi:uncharacterized membrane protein YfcA
MFLLVALAALVAGLLIGITGIGGVLVVPALTEAAQVPLDRAIAASMFAFLLTGGVAAALHLGRAPLPRATLIALCVSAAAGALAGAATLDALPAAAVRIFIAILAIVSGIQALAGSRAAGRALPGTTALAFLGLAVGFGSAISGTGGPVMLIPILLLIGVPLVTAITLALAAQVPIALAATAVNAFAGRLDWLLGMALGVPLIAGAVAGAWLSRRMPGRALTFAVAGALIAMGLWYGYVTIAPPGG